jgi:hypothetical protein
LIIIGIDIELSLIFNIIVSSNAIAFAFIIISIGSRLLYIIVLLCLLLYFRGELLLLLMIRSCLLMVII